MILLDKNRIERTLNRMAFQILEEAHSQPFRLIGVNHRGFAIAQIIKRILEKESGSKISLSNLHSDNGEIVTLKEIKKDEVLFIIDDVIFSGGSMFRIIQKIENLSSFENVIVAVLVDRGHRKFPILAGIVGFDVPTKLNEQVTLHVEDDQPMQVLLSNK